MKRFVHNEKGGAGGDLIMVASIVLILGVLWVLSGGPQNQNSGGSITGPSQGNGIVLTIDRFFTPITRDTSGTSQADQNFQKIVEEYGRARDFGETSPYWGLVTIEKSSSGPRQTSPQSEYVTLRASYKLTKPVTITGWKIQSMVSNEIATIGEATKVSTSGNVDVEQPIQIKPQDKIYVITGHSPKGESFQINKCSGYFTQFQSFTPPIQKQCPLAKNEFGFADQDPLRFGEACLNYIEDIPRCHTPLEALPLGFSDSCATFITEKINYASCVENHRNDKDFFKPEWRVYLKHEGELWGSRDILRLLDADGKTVDVFSYSS